MNGTTVNLNLARKWRSKSFDQIVGQPLSVRMLKNSLYLDNYFPVYLFSGQRGCGKTTTARVFACAVNCERLPDFQKNPKSQVVPCLACDSCKAMSAGKHPDFIEIDAASHTGVDNVRNIIDAASMMPLLGRKKIYLIDEAHMLSKAAFNAFLKILEEPPVSVLFILATTDPHKIIDTVKSRCFQLFFPPIESEQLVQHLIQVCDTERIGYEKAGLQLIVKESEGSARDALNILEQVRFSSSVVSKHAVQQVLGHIDDERLIKLASIVLSQGPADLLRYLQEINVEQFSAQYMWRKLVDLMRTCLWLKHGVVPHDADYAQQDLQKLIRTSSILRINAVLDALYSQEALFAKTTAQHALFEMILLSLCKKSENDNSSGSAPASLQTSVDHDASEVVDEDAIDDEDGEEEEEDDEIEDDAGAHKQWQQFVSDVDSLRDPLLVSIFKQGTVQSFDAQLRIVEVAFSKELLFFADWLSNTKNQWQPLLNRAFGASVELKSLFTTEPVKNAAPKAAGAVEPKKVESALSQPQPAPVRRVAPTAQPAPARPAFKQPVGQSGSTFVKKYPVKKELSGNLLDVSDVNLWKKTNLVLQYFPGVVREIKVVGHEHKA